MAKSNLLRQQQSIDIPFMTSPLVDVFGYLANNKVTQGVLNGTFIVPKYNSNYVYEF